MAVASSVHQHARRYDDVATPAAPDKPLVPKPPAAYKPAAPAAKLSSPSQSAMLALLPGRKLGVDKSRPLGAPRRRVLNANGASLEPLPKLKREVMFVDESIGSFSPSSYSTKQILKGRPRAPTSFSRPTRPLEAADDLRDLCRQMEQGGKVAPAEKKVGMNSFVMRDLSTDIHHLNARVSEKRGKTMSTSISVPALTMTKKKSDRLMRRATSAKKAAANADEMQREESVLSRRGTGGGSHRGSTKGSKKEGKGGRRKAEVAWLNSRHSELVAVFRRLQQDGEVHIDSTKRALELLNFVSPDDGWINEVLETMTIYSTLSFEEFLEFIVDYKAREELAGAEFFAAVDEDHTGSINLDGMAMLLSYCGMFPMRHVLADIAIEVTAMEDVSSDEMFTYDDFRRIFEVLKGREGFTSKDAGTLKGVFRMFDHDHSGDMDTRELMSALGYLGYALPREAIVSVASEVDVDDSGTMNEMEFLKCIRKVHEREIACMKLMFESFDADGSRGISGTELHQMLRALGYYPTNRAIRDSAEDAGITNLREELCFESLWRLCEVYRMRDGLTRAEAQEIEDVFNLVDTLQTGELHTSEVARMFRSLGYPITFDVARKLTDEVDINGTGVIDLAEFKKIVRKYRERDTRNASILYKEFGSVPEAAKKALKILGLDKASKANLNFSDIAELAMFVRKAREKARGSVRAQSGFTDAQCMDLLRMFKAHDTDGSGDIAYKELRDLLTELFPHLASQAEQRPQLLEIVAAADEDRSGTLDFGDFVRLVRQWRDVEEKDKYAKEAAAIKASGFAAPEVRDFRELFMGTVKERARLTLEDLETMLSSTIPLGHRNLQDLKRMYQEEAKPKPHEYTDKLDFPEFLLFMRRLIDMNFAGMAEFDIDEMR